MDKVVVSVVFQRRGFESRCRPEKLVACTKSWEVIFYCKIFQSFLNNLHRVMDKVTDNECGCEMTHAWVRFPLLAPKCWYGYEW